MTAILESINRGIGKEDVVIHTHTHTDTHIMEYYSAIKRNKVVSFAETLMDLETVMQNEVIKKKYHILRHICRIK